MPGTINRNMEFSVPIFYIDLEGFEEHRQPLIDHFLVLRENDSGASRSNQGGWHSHEELFKSEHASVRWLANNLFEAGLHCVEKGNLSPPRQKLAMTACWVNINDFGDWNTPHNHLPDEWAGVCYIDVNTKEAATTKGDRDGDIIFFNPLPLGVQFQRAATITAKPQNGRIFFFPGYLLHMVAPHFEDKPRVSVAFNMKFMPMS